ncbi:MULTISPECIES: alpha/beta hydrolase [Alphaproteobacteria]|uniref:alpha/beta fold hydrolase n=1 Tax=Alphaproteobacteria TaxID=28211 RepID=UPI0019D3EDB5|nr:MULTISPECIES: alpha/beta hydrolase [Alphaproteobacteria]MBN7759195.1 alpha/beta hydrolase [Nitratireductor aquimarinus]MBN7760609.1 alpha/beta hydrolase [Nitratireductor aquibiodomus]MBY6002116.1 alpha/beta hydrolase [Tritonibacter mobilis]MBY6024522.1 alpha/beta hydrolase [Nitratireductor sp. DP7N14-4]
MTLKTLQLSEGYGQLGYREAGEGDIVVLIHGVGMQSAAWGPQIDALSKTHHVFALDMPGHGLTSHLPEGAQVCDYVRWLRTALHALNLQKISLAGHSMGALIAVGFTVTYPELVERVALLNGVFRRDPDARAAVEDRAAQIRAGAFDVATPLGRWFGDSPAEQEARDQVAEWLGSVDHAGYATAYTAFSRGDTYYADHVSGIECPLLALTGEGDPNSTPAMSRAMAQAAQNGHAVIVAGHRHMVNLTAVDTVNHELETWLSIPCALSRTA